MTEHPGWVFRGSRRRLLSLVAVVFGVLALPAAAQANTVTINGSMEGNITIANGDYVAAGYAFSVPGSHPAMIVTMADAKVTITGTCSDGGSGTLTIPLSAGPYDVGANDNSVYPSGDESSSASYQGSTGPNGAKVCGGQGSLNASQGATFSADLQSNVTTSQVQVKFHYSDPNAKGKGNYDCSSPTGGSGGNNACCAPWSCTVCLYPDAPTPPTPPTPPPTSPGTTPTSPGPTTTPVSTTVPTTSAVTKTKSKAKQKKHKKHKKHKTHKNLSRPPRRASGFTG